MKWQGEKIKDLAREHKINLVKLSELTGVTRQTVTAWINGQIPKGAHLISLCRIFRVSPDSFFSDDADGSIAVPAHRTRKKAKVTPALQKDAFKLAREYANFFRNDKNSVVLPVARLRSRDEAAVKKIADDLRKRSGVDRDDEPLDYAHVFNLMANLGIKVVFRYFPDKLKAYVFFTKIYGHRVVFVNNATNVLDLIFPLIHEAVHAIMDEKHISDVFDADEEKFCDDVANHAQFPDEYVDWVYQTVRELSNALQVNKLKAFAEKHGHSLYGLVLRIQPLHPDFDLKIGGADTNLKKKFPAVGDALFKCEDPGVFVKKLHSLSPLFLDMIMRQADDLSERKLGELLDIENRLDVRLVKDELKKMRDDMID